MNARPSRFYLAFSVVFVCLIVVLLSVMPYIPWGQSHVYKSVRVNPADPNLSQTALTGIASQNESIGIYQDLSERDKSIINQAISNQNRTTQFTIHTNSIKSYAYIIYKSDIYRIHAENGKETILLSREPPLKALSTKQIPISKFGDDINFFGEETDRETVENTIKKSSYKTINPISANRLGGNGVIIRYEGDFYLIYHHHMEPNGKDN